MTERPEIEVYSVGMLFLSVCTRLSIEETVRRVNLEYPTGISSEWELHVGFFTGTRCNPCWCDRRVGYRHLLLSC